MSKEKDYTICLSEGSKIRYIAGSYDRKKSAPRYSIEIVIPEHVKSQVQVRQLLIKFSNNYQWSWDIHNKTNWPAFIVIKKDGEII